MKPKEARSVVIAATVILTIVSSLFGISFLTMKLLGLPSLLAFPILVRAVGAGILVLALAETVWLFRYRNPSDMIISTYLTFSKMFRRLTITENAGRTEPLIFKGPQKYVRHPLYSGLVAIVFGWGLVTRSTYDLIASGAILIFIRFVMIPFEEKELRALFGDQYARYVDSTPMLVPFTKRKGRARMYRN
jgi:Phospholipid methyltransferase